MYTINESVPFSINNNGEITVAMSLDYETQNIYDFEVSNIVCASFINAFRMSLNI